LFGFDVGFLTLDSHPCGFGGGAGAAEWHRPAEPAGWAGEAQAQEEAPRPVPKLLLHGTSSDCIYEILCFLYARYLYIAMYLRVPIICDITAACYDHAYRINVINLLRLWFLHNA
jgi:hypothetical protein